MQENREKDAEALDAILESSLLAKAGAIAPSQRIGTTPHKSRVFHYFPHLAFW